VPGTIAGNLHTSARHLIGHRAGSWLNALKDVKDKVQSVTPALPKLLPNTILEANIVNGDGKQYSVDTLPAECLTTEDEGKELHEDSNHCECDQPADAVSAQLPVSSSVCNNSDNQCYDAVSSESTELPSELSTRLCVDNLSVSNCTCDQNCVVSTVPNANQSSVLGEYYSQDQAVNDCVQHEIISQSIPAFEGKQNLPAGEDELNTRVSSQSAVLNDVKEFRTFSASVNDCPEIIFASTRKRTKPAIRGMVIH